jgi:hypothetical protein
MPLSISMRYDGEGMAKGFQAAPYEVVFFFAMKEGRAYGYELATRFSRMTGGQIGRAHV